MIRKSLQLTAAVVATSAALASGAAFAGECPAANVVADGKGQPMVNHAAVGVTDKVIAFTDLAKEKSVNVPGRHFRARRLDIAPGGIVPWHSHGDRPAMILVTEGEIFEYASTCTTPILHKAGDVAAERGQTAHWWKNEGKVPVVIYAFDLFRVEDKKNERMM